MLCAYTSLIYENFDLNIWEIIVNSNKLDIKHKDIKTIPALLQVFTKASKPSKNQKITKNKKFLDPSKPLNTNESIFTRSIKFNDS